MPIYIDKTGYIPDELRSYGVRKDVDAIMSSMPEFAIAGKPISGAGKGKICLAFEAINQARGGAWVDFVQGIGDCVSFADMMAKLVSLAGDIVARGEQEEFREISTEWSYGAGRVLVGKGRLGNGDGSIGSWQVKADRIHGTLFRQPYGQHDLTKYSAKRAKSWGYRGLPLDLEQTADLHQIPEDAIPARGFEDIRDAMASIYGAFICSNQGFSDKRDSQGFARPSGSWSHGMGCIGSQDTNRPGILIYNQWPATWISGPRTHNQPQPSFWADAEIIDKMCRSNDAWIIPGLNGIKKTDGGSWWI